MPEPPWRINLLVQGAGEKMSTLHVQARCNLPAIQTLGDTSTQRFKTQGIFLIVPKRGMVSQLEEGVSGAPGLRIHIPLRFKANVLQVREQIRKVEHVLACGIISVCNSEEANLRGLAGRYKKFAFFDTAVPEMQLDYTVLNLDLGDF